MRAAALFPLAYAWVFLVIVSGRIVAYRQGKMQFDEGMTEP